MACYDIYVFSNHGPSLAQPAAQNLALSAAFAHFSADKCKCLSAKELRVRGGGRAAGSGQPSAELSQIPKSVYDTADIIRPAWIKESPHCFLLLTMITSIDDVYLPRILFGKKRAVKPAWWKVTRLAWQAGSWSEAESGLEFLPASELSRQLDVWRPDNPRLAGHDLWRLYVINDALVKLQDALGADAHGDRFREFLCDGFDRFWFVLGLLDTTAPHGLLTGRLLSGAAKARSDCMLYLARIVRWLDALQVIAPFFFRSEEPDPQPIMVGRIQISESVLWVLLVLRLARGAGFQIDMLQVLTDYGGNIADALIGEGIVQRGGGGKYELQLRE